MSTVMQQLVWICALQISLFLSAIDGKFHSDHAIQNITSSSVTQLQSKDKVTHLPWSMFEWIREFQPVNIIESNRRFNITQCDEQLAILRTGASKLELWALKMLDSSSKIPSGMLIGNMKDYGMYDECVGVTVEKGTALIRGRHCMYSLTDKTSDFPKTLSPTLSICLPAVCNAEHLTAMVQDVINSSSKFGNLTIEVGDVSCSPVDAEPLGIGEILTMVIFSVIVCFLIVCTIYDVYIRTIPKAAPKSSLSDLCKFSIYTNFLRICDTTVPPGTITTVYGLRFFSQCWIILKHEYLSVIFEETILNVADANTWKTSWGNELIVLAPGGVDTFFVVGGFLTSYLFIKDRSKGRKFNLVMYYFHRYLRLTPALAATLVMTIYVFPRLGNGAWWDSVVMLEKTQCEKKWWSMMLYFHNHIGDPLQCLGHTWFLAVDMQLFWISPIILHPLAKRLKIGLCILTVFIIASGIITAFDTAMNESITVFSSAYDYRKSGAWFMGVYLGYELAKKKRTPSRRMMLLGWSLCIIAFSSLFFTFRIFQSTGYKQNAPWDMLYAGLAKQIWGFSVCWLIYASFHGYGGLLGRFLSHPILVPFGKISYCVYLIHWPILKMRIGARRTPAYFSDYALLFSFCGELIVSIIAGLALSLFFESPFFILDRMIFSGRKEVVNHVSHEKSRDLLPMVALDKYTRKHEDIEDIEDNNNKHD